MTKSALHLFPRILTKLPLVFTAFSLFASSAFGAVSMNMALTVPNQATVGASGQTGSLSFTRTSTAPNTFGNLTLSGIKLTPGSGSSPAPPSIRDPGVFSYVTAVGRAGTAFGGLTFTISLSDPTTGEVELIPSAPPTLLGPPGSAAATGIIDFTFNVVKIPFFDAQPGTAGLQTYHLARAFGTKDSITVNVRPSSSVTVLRAQPSLSTSTPGTIQLGGSISNAATLSGAVNPTGTITFTLFGPDNNTCSGAPIFTSVKPVNAGGTATSGAYTPSSGGTYRWRVVYSGDANNISATRDCGDPSNTVRVLFLVIVSIQKAANNVTIVFQGLAGQPHQVQYRNTLNPFETWTTLPGIFVADGTGRFTFNETTALPSRFYRGVVP